MLLDYHHVFHIFYATIDGIVIICSSYFQSLLLVCRIIIKFYINIIPWNLDKLTYFF